MLNGPQWILTKRDISETGNTYDGKFGKFICSGTGDRKMLPLFKSRKLAESFCEECDQAATLAYFPASSSLSKFLKYAKARGITDVMLNPTKSGKNEVIAVDYALELLSQLIQQEGEDDSDGICEN